MVYFLIGMVIGLILIFGGILISAKLDEREKHKIIFGPKVSKKIIKKAKHARVYSMDELEELCK